MADWTAQLSTVNRLLQKFGAACQYNRATIAVGDTNWLPTSANSIVYPGVTIMSTNAGVVRYFKFKISPEEQRPVGVLQMLMPGNVPFVPQYRDAIDWTDGDRWYVTAFDVLAPDGTPLLYYLEVAH